MLLVFFFIFLILSFNSFFFSWVPSSGKPQRALRTLRMVYFFEGKLLSFSFSPFPLSFSYTCRHLRRYVYVLDKLCFPHSHCSTLQHCFSTLSDNGEELLSLTCSHILRSYASRLLILLSLYCMLHAPVTADCMFKRDAYQSNEDRR